MVPLGGETKHIYKITRNMKKKITYLTIFIMMIMMIMMIMIIMEKGLETIGGDLVRRLESPLVAETSPRRLLETSRVSGEPREIQTYSIFCQWGRLFPVPSRSRRRLRNVSISCGDVTVNNFVRVWGILSPTSPRHFCDVSETWKPRRLRRRCGDCRRPPRLPGELVVILSGDVSETSRRRL